MSRGLQVAVALTLASLGLTLYGARCALAEELPGSVRWNKGILQQDQPRIHRLFAWGDQLIVHADGFYALDIARARLERVTLPGSVSILDLAAIDARRAAILSRDASGLYLLQGSLQSAARIEVSEALRHSQKVLRVFASSATVGVWGGDTLFIERGGHNVFRALQLPVSPVSMGGLPLSMSEPLASDPVLVTDSTLFVGYDRGEWGGALFSTNLSTGQVESLGIKFPVTDLKIDPAGRLWLTGGLAHGCRRSGYVWRRADRVWSTILATDNHCRENVSEGLAPWPLPVDPIESIAFDRAGVPYVLSGRLGVVRYDAGAWTPVAPFWPSQEPVAVRGLQILSDSTFVIATRDGGVLLWKPGDPTVRRITVRP